MKKLLKTILILILSLNLIAPCVAESLFTLGATQNFYTGEAKSLYSGVRARTVGDLVTIIMQEQVTLQDNLSYNTDRTSTTTDNFSSLIKAWIPNSILKPEINQFGGSNSVESSTQNQRTLKMQDYITAQVVELLPNGNLVIQGKKTLINAGEKVDLVVSGVVDPRWISDAGQINSYNVANLQFALTGKGSVSRSGGEGIINRFIRYLF